MRTATFAAAGALLTAAPAAAQQAAELRALPRELSGFGNDPSLLPSVIRQVESGGGRMVEIRYDSHAGHPRFDAVVANGAAVSFLRIALPGRSVTVVRDHTEAEWELAWPTRYRVNLAKTATVGMADAVEEAESDNRGAAAAAAGIAARATAPTSPIPVYNVLLVRYDLSLVRAAVDARTGLTITDTSQLAPWP